MYYDTSLDNLVLTISGLYLLTVWVGFITPLSVGLWLVAFH